MKACEVLNVLGITRSTLYNYYTDGKIRFEKLHNGRLCYNDKDVQRLKGNIRKIWEYNITHDPIGTQKIIIEKLKEFGYKE
jgi:predicted site-specific integrase-resolvase